MIKIKEGSTERTVRSAAVLFLWGLLLLFFLKFEPGVSSASFYGGLFIFSRFINSIGQVFEHFIDIRAILSRYEVMGGVVLFGEFLCLFMVDHSQIL